MALLRTLVIAAALFMLLRPVVVAETRGERPRGPVLLVDNSLSMTQKDQRLSAADRLYSTSLFWLTSAVLFYIAPRNFKEERLFSEKKLFTRMREFLSEILSQKHPNFSLFLLSGFSYHSSSWRR